MTGLLVSRRTGVGTAPDGTKFRLARGKTIADARHPLVLAYPDNWMPIQVDLAYDDPDDCELITGAPEDLRNEVIAVTARAEASEAEAGAYRAQLEAVAEVLIRHGYAPPAELAPGWLAALVDEAVAEAHPETQDDAPDEVTAALERPAEQVEVIVPAGRELADMLKDVAPPAKARRRVPRAAS